MLKSPRHTGNIKCRVLVLAQVAADGGRGRGRVIALRDLLIVVYCTSLLGSVVAVLREP